MPYSRWDSVLTAPESGTVIAVAVYTAKPERVFRALTDADEMQQWWGGGRGGSTIVWEGQPKAGTRWEARGEFSGGRIFTAWGEFREVEPDQHYVQSWHTSWDEGLSSEVSVRFKPVKDGTALTLVHHGFINRRDACQAQAQMWWKIIKWLRPHLQNHVFVMSPSEEHGLHSAPNN
jgi:uncharacterized protein YndB with AHSA1/START domain